MAKQNSVNLNITNNADGFEIAGGTSDKRTLSISGGDVSIVSSGNATLTVPATTDTLATLTGTQTLTNKTITSATFNTSLLAGSVSMSLLNTVATSVNAFGASLSTTMGADSVNSSFRFRGANFVVGTTASNDSKIIGYNGNLILSSGNFGSSGSQPSIWIEKTEKNISTEFADVWLYPKSYNVAAAKIGWYEANAEYFTSFQLAALTQNRTINVPDASGTLITTGNLSSITSTGTISSGTWQGTTIGTSYGGTGLTSFTSGGAVYASGASTLATGTLPVTAGGTGSSNGSITGSGSLTFTAGGSNTSINLVPNGTGTVDVASKRISSLATPSSAADAATKAYVDMVAQGLHQHQTANLATTATISTVAGAAVTFNAGNQSITWSGGDVVDKNNFVDGHGLVHSTTESAASRLLIKNEGSAGGLGAAFNGVYYAYGSRELRRSSDSDTSSDWAGGDFVFILDGTLYGGTGWVQTENVTTLNTDSIYFQQFSGAGTYSADGVTLQVNGSQFAIKDTYAGQTSITTLGTVSVGTWQGATIGAAYGGTGVTSLGSGLSTWFVTPSSSNLAAAITDETGSGSLVFGTSPSFTTSVVSSGASMDVFNTTATTVNAFGAATSLSIGSSATSPQTVNMFTSSTDSSTYNIATGATASTRTKAINLGTGGLSGSATNITLGSSAGGATTINSPTTSIGYSLTFENESSTNRIQFRKRMLPDLGLTPAAVSSVFSIWGGTDDGADDLPIFDVLFGVDSEEGEGYAHMVIGNSCIYRYDIAPMSRSLTGPDDPVAYVNFAYGDVENTRDGGGGATKFVNIATGGTTCATNVVIGSGVVSSIYLQGDTYVGGNLTVSGTTTNINSITMTVDDKNIELGSVSSINNVNATLNLSTSNAFIYVGSTSGMAPGQTLTKASGTGALGAGARILTVDSATRITATVNHATAGTLVFNVGAATDLTADGGGITLKGSTDKTIIWDNANQNWTSSEHLNLATGKSFKVNNTSVLSSTAVLGMSISGGTVSAGTWQGTAVGTAYGGTGLTTFTSGGAVYATSASALTSGTLPVASGGTGSIDGSITGTGAITFTAGGSNTNINLAPHGTGTVDVSSKKITNLANPTTSTDAANKGYVDNVAISDLNGVTISSPVAGQVLKYNGTAWINDSGGGVSPAFVIAMATVL